MKGNSFNYNFNTALGVFGTNNLLVENNVVYFTLGASIRIWGEMNQLIHNLVIYSASEATYKDRQDRSDPNWPGAIEADMALNPVLIDNAIGKGSLYFIVSKVVRGTWVQSSCTQRGEDSSSIRLKVRF